MQYFSEKLRIKRCQRNKSRKTFRSAAFSRPAFPRLKADNTRFVTFTARMCRILVKFLDGLNPVVLIVKKFNQGEIFMKNKLKWFAATIIITFAMGLSAAAQAVELCKDGQFMGSGGRCQTVGSGGRMSSESSQIYGSGSRTDGQIIGSGSRSDSQIVGSGAATGPAPEDGGLIGSGTAVDPPKTGEGLSFWGWLYSVL
jgi:hypothetical protein